MLRYQYKYPPASPWLVEGILRKMADFPYVAIQFFSSQSQTAHVYSFFLPAICQNAFQNAIQKKNRKTGSVIFLAFWGREAYNNAL